MVVGAIIVAACLRYPPLAVVILLGAMFLRLALPHLILADPFIIAFWLVLASAAVWMWQHRDALPRVSFVEVAMVLYTLWCYGSMVLPHQYLPVTYPLNGTMTAVARFIETQHGHPVHDVPAGEAAVRPRVGGAARVVVDPRLRRVLHAGEHLPVLRTEPGVAAVHRDRTELAGTARIGVSNQPVANGMILIVGFVIAIVLATERGQPAWRRALLWLYALASPLAIYLTHTRADWLAFALVLVLGVLLVPGPAACSPA